MWRWLKRIFGTTWKSSVPVQVRIVQRDPLRITTRVWRSDPNLVTQAARALNEPVLRQMLDVLQASHLAKVMLMDNSPNARSIHLARCEGFSMALEDFESLGQYQKPQEAVEATFEDELPE